MADLASITDRRMSIGRVFGRAFGAIGAHPVTMFGLAFVFGALPTGLMTLATIYDGLVVRTDAGRGALLIILYVGSMLLKIVFTMLAQGALVRATIAHSEGTAVEFGVSAMAAVRKIVPLLVLAVLSVIGVGFASVLLLVPGIILYVIWSVAAPALVAEDRGIFDAFVRSADLTRGARWNVFAVELVLLMLYYAVAAVSGLVLVAAVGFQGLAAGSSVAVIVTTATFTTLSTTVSAAIQTSLYVELRDWKDGPAADALGDIFA